MTKSKIIVVWSCEDIFCSSIKHFLAPKEDWKVVSISNKEDLDALILAEEIKNQGFVIIHQGNHNDPTNLSLQFLQDHPEVRVIQISLEDNVLDVFSKQKISITEVSDLITVIENES